MKNLFYLFLLAIPVLLIAQSPVANDVTQANLLYCQSVTFYEQGECQNAVNRLERIAKSFEKSGNLNTLIYNKLL